MEENCQYGIWTYHLSFHSIPCPGRKISVLMCKSSVYFTAPTLRLLWRRHCVSKQGFCRQRGRGGKSIVFTTTTIALSPVQPALWWRYCVLGYYCILLLLLHHVIASFCSVASNKPQIYVGRSRTSTRKFGKNASKQVRPKENATVRFFVIGR